MRVLLDTSVLVPALVPALPQHENAALHLESAHRGETHLIISSHALAECYSSLTALPVSPAVTPGQARRLIEENVAEAAEDIVRLGESEYLEVLQRMADLRHRSTESPPERDTVVVAISDNGPGLAPEQREVLFEPFEPGKNGGTGLGLAVANDLTEAMDGKIEVCSKTGEGTCFRVCLSALE